MKVILLKDVAKVGRIHEIKEVADGYALNSLIPRGLAKLATADEVKKHTAKVAAANAAHSKKVNDEEARLRALDGSTVTYKAAADKSGHLYKKLDAKNIAEIIGAHAHITPHPEWIHLSEPIRTIGEHTLIVENPRTNVRASLVLAIVV